MYHETHRGISCLAIPLFFGKSKSEPCYPLFWVLFRENHQSRSVTTLKRKRSFQNEQSGIFKGFTSEVVGLHRPSFTLDPLPFFLLTPPPYFTPLNLAKIGVKTFIKFQKKKISLKKITDTHNTQFFQSTLHPYLDTT